MAMNRTGGVPGSDNLDIKAVVRDIFSIKDDIEKNGLYDQVVLDSVLNSITSNSFEHYVLTACNALMRPDGRFYTSTRSLQQIESRGKLQKSLDRSRLIEFLDEDNYSATFRNGVWTMQKFHNAQTLEELLSKYFADVRIIDQKKGQLWAICEKPKRLSLETYREALDIEFNMEYPGGYRHGKHGGIVKAILAHHVE